MSDNTASSSMSSTDRMRRKCLRCKHYATHSVFNHFYCSAHRACTQSTGFTPTSCNSCAEFRENCKQLNSSECDKLISLYRKEIIRVQNNKDYEWHYSHEFQKFFGLSPFSSSHFRETPENSERDLTPIPTEAGFSVNEPNKNKENAEISDLRLYQVVEKLSTSVESVIKRMKLIENTHFTLPQLFEDIIKSHIPAGDNVEAPKHSNESNARGGIDNPNIIMSSDEDESLDDELLEHHDSNFSTNAQVCPLPVYLIDGQTWLEPNEQTNFSGEFVEIQGKFRSYVKHPTRNLIRLLDNVQSLISKPFFSVLKTHEILKKACQGGNIPDIKFGIGDRHFIVPFQDDSDTAWIFNKLHEWNSQIFSNLLTKDDSSFKKTF